MAMSKWNVLLFRRRCKFATCSDFTFEKSGGLEVIERSRVYECSISFQLTYMVYIYYKTMTIVVMKPLWKQVKSSKTFKTSLSEIILQQRKTSLMTNIYLKCAGWTAFGLGMKH